MRRVAPIAAIAMLCAGSGCVQQDKYNDTVLSNRALKEQLVAAERDRDTANANVGELRGQLTQARAANSDLETQIIGLNADLDTQARRYDELLTRVSQLEFGPLPVELEEALDHLAAAYPDLLTFDASRGLLRFSSDFTFDLGSASLKPDAAATIATLADILVAPEAAPFELRVIGHTDNVPVERPRTKQLHPTNMYLSVHRAISVRDELVAAGVEPPRIQVAGYGEYRPIVPNGVKGAAANRRVELLLVPLRTESAKRAAEAEMQTGLEEPMK
ncbi:MAG: OmpA/MotB family protein [Planctomycetota bacterium]|jgi:flagellar motor protein MotB